MAGAHGKPVADPAVVPAAGSSAPGSGLRIRLVGLPEEVLAGAEALARVFDLVEVSPAYPCRGASLNVRAYLQARRRAPKHEAALVMATQPPDEGLDRTLEVQPDELSF